MPGIYGVNLNKMKVQDARQLGEHIAEKVYIGQVKKASDLLAPVLMERTSFRLLDEIGAQIGNEITDASNIFLDQVAAQGTMGGWVVIASILRQQLPHDLHDALEHCRKFVYTAKLWYATDIFGERVPGPALVNYFEPTLSLLLPWREDANCWVRRMVGVAIHFWAKQARGSEKNQTQVSALLDFLEPMFTEQEIEALKGVGWGLKTLGRYFPMQITDWLVKQTAKPFKALMLRKATTYLPTELRQRIYRNMP